MTRRMMAAGLGAAMLALGACRADVKVRTLELRAADPRFDGEARQWVAYVPRGDDKCVSVAVDTITGPYDKVAAGEPAACSVRLVVPDAAVPNHGLKNVIVLKFEQGDRLCYLLKRSEKLILVFGPEGELRSVEDHYPPAGVGITQ